MPFIAMSKNLSDTEAPESIRAPLNTTFICRSLLIILSCVQSLVGWKATPEAFQITFTLATSDWLAGLL